MTPSPQCHTALGVFAQVLSHKNPMLEGKEIVHTCILSAANCIRLEQLGQYSLTA